MTLTLYSTDEGPAPLVIGDHDISAYSRPYVVAEIGVNHDGDPRQARRLIDAAAGAGADAVKLQIFSADSLVCRHAPSAGYQGAAEVGQHQLLKELELSAGDFNELAEHCVSAGVAFLATPFTVEDLQTVLDLGAPAIKIASTDLNNVLLLEAAARRTVPILLSTGASEFKEIDEAVSLIDQNESCDRLILLHCVSSYPTPLTDASLSTIGLLRERYNVWSGYSDHTDCIESAGLAVAAGARVLEKHFTLKRSLKGPDHAFSLDPKMFKDYVRSAQSAWRMLGEPRRGVLDVEQDVRRVARKSVVANVPIKKDQIITSELLTLKRPGGGIEPREIPRVVGKKARRDIAPDTPIDWTMLTS